MKPAVIFDIDGTLVDTNYLHTLAWRRAVLDCGEDVPSASIHRMIGAGSDVLLKELLGEKRTDVKDAWRRHFDELKPEIRALPGAPELLRTLAGRGVAVALASSSEQDDVDALLDALGCRDVLSAVTSSADVEEAKPSAEVFEVAMERLNAVAEGAVVVGDTVWDVEAARRAGLRCICVLTGGSSEADLRAAGAHAVYPGLPELLDRLDDALLAEIGVAEGAPVRAQAGARQRP